MAINFFSGLNVKGLTNHARQEMLLDKRGLIKIPTNDDIKDSKNNLIEFYECMDEDNNPVGVIQKALIRVHHMHEKYDLCYLIAKDGWIVSAWAVDKLDEHRLNKSLELYYRPKELYEQTATPD
jgi:hypothetical protein